MPRAFDADEHPEPLNVQRNAESFNDGVKVSAINEPSDSLPVETTEITPSTTETESTYWIDAPPEPDATADGISDNPDEHPTTEPDS